jgi:antitoxin ParD1/3/4
MHVTVDLSDEEVRFIESAVRDGRFTSASEVVREALLLLEHMSYQPEPGEPSDEEKLAWLRAAVQEGIDSGIAGPFDPEELKAEARRRRAAQS